MKKKRRFEPLSVKRVGKGEKGPSFSTPPIRTLKLKGAVHAISWSPDGRILASSCTRREVILWDAETGKPLQSVPTKGLVRSLAFDASGKMLAGGSSDSGVELWDVNTGRILSVGVKVKSSSGVSWSNDGSWLASCSDKGLEIWDTKTWRSRKLNSPGSKDVMLAVAWAADSSRIAIASYNAPIWEVATGKLLHELGNRGGLYDVAFSTDNHSNLFATATSFNTADVWNASTGALLVSLEGHTDHVAKIEFSADGRLLVSSARDGAVKLWSCADWSEVAAFPGQGEDHINRPIAFHPTSPMIAVAALSPRSDLVEIYQYDVEKLIQQPARSTVKYTSAKVVLVGDSGVGKTGLGWRLAHGEFKEHSSTHGQQFWILNQLCKQRIDGTECEAVLWDLAGQDDYRLIHALFLDDTDLALVLFDPSHHDDPLGGVEFWLRQLRGVAQPDPGIPIVLVAARTDRGTPRLTQQELESFCHQRNIQFYSPTSARTGEGVDDLVKNMRSLVRWEDRPATVTTETFKRIKDFVLTLKENSRRKKVVFTSDELRKRLLKTDSKWTFTDAEMLTAVGHLATHGYVTLLKTSHGEPRILLAPELLNNLAASFVLAARRNRRGLGSLEEGRLLSRGYKFPELAKLADLESDILLDSATALFLDHNICFRETDPLHGSAYLVFPELINLKRPIEDDSANVVDGSAYTVSGAVENVYASLVVLMGYTQTFSRTNQWWNHARYEVGDGQVCGFRLDAERAGELDLVLYFGSNTTTPAKMLFQGLFESFLGRRNLTVRRFEPVSCKNGHFLNRAVVREQMSEGISAAFCNRCGEKMILPEMDRPIQLTKIQVAAVEADRRVADGRSRFEQVLFRLKTHVTEQKIVSPECFISYAWGELDHERWVEKSLATDLQKAGVAVILDRWENARIGVSVPRFVERVAKSDRIIVVGTPLYRRKYDNNEPMRGFVVAAEGDLIGKRMIGTEESKESVLPLLLDGSEEISLPHLLHGRVYADFRRREAYFNTTLELLFSLYGIKPTELVAVDLRATLAASRNLMSVN